MNSKLQAKLSYIVGILGLQLVILFSLQCSASSFSSAYSSLQRSRDALLDQRKYLQSEADKLSNRIYDLQKQLDTVNAYLRDNDRTLRDVEYAIRRLPPEER